MTEADTTAVDPETSMRLAESLFEAIAANDAARLRSEVYDPEVVVWHNNDDHEQHIDENLKVLGWLHRKIADKRYEEVRRQPTPTGFIEQHVLRGTAPNGSELNVFACLVVRVRAGRIVRIDEYLDGNAIAAIAG